MRRIVLAARPFLISIVAVTALATPLLAQNPPDFVVNGTNSAGGNSWVAGAQGGYNFHTGSAVYGFETDFSFTNLQSSMNGSLGCFSFGSSVAVQVSPRLQAQTHRLALIGTAPFVAVSAGRLVRYFFTERAGSPTARSI